MELYMLYRYTQCLLCTCRIYKGIIQIPNCLAKTPQIKAKKLQLSLIDRTWAFQRNLSQNTYTYNTSCTKIDLKKKKNNNPNFLSKLPAAEPSGGDPLHSLSFGFTASVNNVYYIINSCWSLLRSWRGENGLIMAGKARVYWMPSQCEADTGTQSLCSCSSLLGHQGHSGPQYLMSCKSIQEGFFFSWR